MIDTTCMPAERTRKCSRRAVCLGGAAATLGIAAWPFVRELWAPQAAVFIARHQTYTGALEQTIADGLSAVGMKLEQLRGKQVLLKPNLVEPMRNRPHMTTHPAVILAAAEVFRRHGATVTVGEAPGHVRDTEMALCESGVGEALESAGLEFADLNYQQVAFVKNIGGYSKLPGLYFPQSVIEADLIVSLPKLKTHHWVGMTAAMKNLYGILPGIMYGWPKNVLHYAGIHNTVADINAAAPPTIAIVDAIECMEGDGPILGTPKQMGLILIGQNAAAVDATCARIMGLNPARINYLQLVADRLGPIHERRIAQRGERWQELASQFSILEVPHLTPIRHGI